MNPPWWPDFPPSVFAASGVAGIKNKNGGGGGNRTCVREAPDDSESTYTPKTSLETFPHFPPQCEERWRRGAHGELESPPRTVFRPRGVRRKRLAKAEPDRGLYGRNAVRETAY